MFLSFSSSQGRSHWTAITGQKLIKINDMTIPFGTMFVCDECPGITIIMSTQINLEQDWVCYWKCVACALHSQVHSSAHNDLYNTKVSIKTLFPLFKFNICQAPVLKSMKKSLVTSYRKLIENLSSTMCIYIGFALWQWFLAHMPAVLFCAANGHVEEWLWRSRYWQRKGLSTKN